MFNTQGAGFKDTNNVCIVQGLYNDAQLQRDGSEQDDTCLMAVHVYTG